MFEKHYYTLNVEGHSLVHIIASKKNTVGNEISWIITW